MDLGARVREGDVRALSHAIRMVEDGEPEGERLVRSLALPQRTCHVVGITGPPGSGKSTLCDALISEWRKGDHDISVIAVDPSSPFSGGAILGDRVRMQRHALDPHVFIRSMAARGHLGGLASATRDALRLIDASGRRTCLLETVGVGQSELEVMALADTTVVVTTPAAGDGVQLIKAGIMEIADVFVVNKGDMPGATPIVKGLREAAHTRPGADIWEAPVLVTKALEGEGIAELADAIARHRAVLQGTPLGEEKAQRRWRADVEAIVVERARERTRSFLTQSNPATVEGELDPYSMADRILSGPPGE